MKTQRFLLFTLFIVCCLIVWTSSHAALPMAVQERKTTPSLQMFEIAKQQRLQRVSAAAKRLFGPLADIYDDYHHLGAARAHATAQERDVTIAHHGLVVVVAPVQGITPQRLAAGMAAQGIAVCYTGKASVTAEVSLAQLDALSADSAHVRFVTLPTRAHCDNTTISEGIGYSITNAKNWHDRGQTGAGVKIGIIDAGFQGLAQLKASDEIPTSAVEVDFTGQGMENGQKHGCGVAEIVYDTAPGAQLYLLNVGSDDTENGIVQAEQYCVSHGIRIISMSLSYDGYNFFDGMSYSTMPDSPVDMAADAASHGILWINSAGNYRLQHALIPWTDPDNTGILMWSPDENVNSIGSYTAGSRIEVTLTWNAWPATDQDFDLYLMRYRFLDGWEVVTKSQNIQNGTQPPYEYISFPVETDGSYGIQIKRSHATSSPTFILRNYKSHFQYFSYNNTNVDAPAPGSIGSPADSANVLAVGAVSVNKYTTGPAEYFSSMGPTNRAYTGGVAQIKPDICGPDGTNSVTFGAFFGTSASCPHVAAAAALVWSKNPTWTAAQVRAHLETGSRNPDLGNAGKDNTFGYGPLMLRSANTQAPAAVADHYQAPTRNPLVVFSPGVLANDTSPYGAPLTASKVSNPLHGSLLLNSNGSFAYTPCIGFLGTDSFTYTASDSQLTSNTATVFVNVLPNRQADLTIRTVEAAYIGDGIYNTDGTNQTQSLSASNAIPSYYYCRAQNDGNTVDTFTIKGPASARGWAVKYFDMSTGSEITTAVTGAGWSTGPLAPLTSRGFWAQVTPSASVPNGDFCTLLITAVSATDATKRDAVKAVSTLTYRYQPDLWLRVADESYTGDNYYDNYGYAQQRMRTISARQSVTYLFQVQNDANTSDTISVKMTAAGSGWTMTCIDAQTNANIGAALTGAGWSTGLLARGARKCFYITVRPGSGTTDTVDHTTLITATSAADPTKVDKARTVTRFSFRYQPDIWIRNVGETTYGGDNIYGDNDLQKRTRTVSAGTPATYIFRVQNDGETVDTFTISAYLAFTGWPVRVFDSSNTEITSQVGGNGWQVGPLAPGASVGFYATVTPASTQGVGNSLSFSFYARSQHGINYADAARVETIVRSPSQPDLWIRTAAETAYTGDNVYEYDGAQQTKTLATSAGTPAIFLIRAQNDGVATDTLTVYCSPIPSGWTVTCRDIATDADVTADLRGAGWVCPNLAPGATAGIIIRAIPSAAVPIGVQQNLRFRVQSGAQPAVQDNVNANFKRQ